VFPGNARPSLASCPGRTVEGMDTRDEVRDFLTSRRDRLTPGQAGIPRYGGRRRVKGLRREEVAMLAGMSTDYYTRLERGNLSGVSGSVLDALARALQLDEAERTHLFDLAATANAPGQTGRSAPGHLRAPPVILWRVSHPNLFGSVCSRSGILVALRDDRWSQSPREIRRSERSMVHDGADRNEHRSGESECLVVQACVVSTCWLCSGWLEHCWRASQG
jgi:hypothetical protein